MFTNLQNMQNKQTLLKFFYPVDTEKTVITRKNVNGYTRHLLRVVPEKEYETVHNVQSFSHVFLTKDDEILDISYDVDTHILLVEKYQTEPEKESIKILSSSN